MAYWCLYSEVVFNLKPFSPYVVLFSSDVWPLKQAASELCYQVHQRLSRHHYGCYYLHISHHPYDSCHVRHSLPQVSLDYRHLSCFQMLRYSFATAWCNGSYRNLLESCCCCVSHSLAAMPQSVHQGLTPASRSHLACHNHCFLLIRLSFMFVSGSWLDLWVGSLETLTLQNPHHSI